LWIRAGIRALSRIFVSYTQTDRAWAEWIAWELEEAGHRALGQAWDFVPGSNWIQGMQEGVTRAGRTIAVLSPAYLESEFGAAEWQAAWGKIRLRGTASCWWCGWRSVSGRDCYPGWSALICSGGGGEGPAALDGVQCPVGPGQARRQAWFPRGPGGAP
jgi:TIR domain